MESPASIELLLPGNRERFIATELRFDSAVLAPPPGPPKQLPVSVQMFPVTFGRVSV